MKKLIVIDGNSLLFRCYYATAYGGNEIMRTKDGVPTNAIFAFSNMINKIVSTLKENDAIMVAFDTGRKTFRHEALETYKANRAPAPEDLKEQFPIAREFLEAMNIYQFEEDGFEGDDIAGTIAERGASQGYEVHIYTSDRDFLQLSSENITINTIRKGLSDVVEMTPSLVKETYGFEPKQIIDYKGLRGDSSDNLPGIPGVGEKTAVKLIQEYGDFDNIIAHAEDIGGKLGQNLIEKQELGRLCRDLAIIQTDVDIPFDVEDTIYHGYKFTRLNDFCQRYELKQFISRVSSKWKMEDEDSEELNVERLTSLKNFKDVKEIGLAIDLDGSDYSRNEVYGVAFNINSKHVYIALEDLEKDETALSYLKDKNIKKYCYDYKAIKVALARYNIEVNGLYFDLLIGAYLLDPSVKSEVNAVMNFFGVDLPKRETISLFTVGDDQLTGQIAFYSRALYQKVKNELEKVKALDLMNNLELPLTEVLAEMEIEGFPLDANTLDEFGDEFKRKAEEIEKEIYELAGEEFNIASPKQVADILFRKLGIRNPKKDSTSVDVLKEISHEHPIVDKILEYRKYFKLITTYIEGLKPHIFKDGKIHAKFNQALTQTGRLSSSEPNLQNISIRDEEGKMIRKAFYYPNEEYEILSLDYSQIELRMLAFLSNCQPLKEVFLHNEDIHSATAKKIFHLEGEPDDHQRRRAKTVNFGIVYGISDWGLAEQLEISPKEARGIINSFYDSYPEIRDFFTNIVQEVTENGYVSTIMGRRRYLREIHDSNYQRREFAKRAAMNAPIQGSAADLIKMAMIKVNNKLKENHLKTKMVLQIHDELIFKVPKEEKEIVYNLVKDTMEHAMEMDVPLQVDGGFGLTWYDAK